MQRTVDTPWPRPGPEWAGGLPPFPALPLTEPLRARLWHIRERQMAEHLAGRPQLVCGVFYDEEVVCLRAGGGHAADDFFVVADPTHQLDRKSKRLNSSH